MYENNSSAFMKKGTYQRQLRFIDLFAGLGGFHLALKNLGHECIFASEIDETLRSTYYENFGMRPSGDIREVAAESIPRHDVNGGGMLGHWGVDVQGKGPH